MFLLLAFAVVHAEPSPSVSPPPTPVVEVPGERAEWVQEGDTIRVNNALCAVSHSPLDPAKRSAFTSTVTYNGADPRFRGKRMVFNQCCEMCIARFPAMWAADADSVLRFHGLI